MKQIKLLTSVATIGTVVGPIAAVISCGGAKNEYSDSKEIVIAVDPNQRQMWDQIQEAFQKTDPYKKGYRIKEVQKDAWGAIDLIKTIGSTDENSPDLIYMPQDKLTELAQIGALRPFTNVERDDILKDAGISETEKSQAVEFGSISFGNKKTFLVVPHNKEGIVVASKASESSVRNDLNTFGMVGLMNKAKALWRLQDGWYASALFAKPITSSTLGETLTDYILTGEGTNWESGFIKTNTHHADFKYISDAMADMWFEPLMKAFGVAGVKTNMFIGADWATNNISPANLQAFFQSNMGAVNTFLIEQVEKDSLDYLYAGTWDIGNISKRGITSFVNPTHFLRKVSGNNEGHFVQASGTWSWGINSRNNGVKKARIDAIMQVLKLIYSKDAYTQYHLQDSKVPFAASKRTDVKNNVSKINQATINKGVAYYDDTNFIVAFNTLIGAGTKVATNKANNYDKLKALFDAISSFKKQYDIIKNANPTSRWLDDSSTTVATTSSLKMHSKLIAPGLMQGNDKDSVFTKNYFKGTIGPTELIANILKKSTIAGLNGYREAHGTAWQIKKSDLKANATDFNKIKHDDLNAHINKFLKLFTSFDRDSNDEKAQFMEKFSIDVKSVIDRKKTWAQAVKDAQAKFAKIIQEIKRKAKTIIAGYVKMPNIDTLIAGAIEGYLNNFWNTEVKNAQYKMVVNFMDNSPEFSISWTKASVLTTEKISNIEELVTKALNSFSLGKIMDVIDAPGTNDLGKFETQSGRFDRLNPQFASFWGLWNEQTFGNAKWLKEEVNNIYKDSTLTTKAQAEQRFKEAVETRLDKLFSDKVKTLIKAKSSGLVKL